MQIWAATGIAQCHRLPSSPILINVWIFLYDFFVAELVERLVPSMRGTFCIPKYRVGNTAIVSPNVSVREGALPNDLIKKSLCAENSIEHQFEIVTGGRIAMEIKAAGGFEDAMQFDQARSHHGQIRHHGGISEKIMERIHHFHDGGVWAIVHKLGVGLRGVGPIPGVGEGVELRLAGFTGSLAEEDVVIGIGVERRVEVNEVNAGVRKKLRVAQPVEIVAKQQTVHGRAL